MRILRLSHVPGRTRDGIGRPVDVVLTWNAARPHEVAVGLQGEGYDTDRWVFDGGLLAAGLTRPVGLGAVTVLPDLSPMHDGQRVVLVLATSLTTVALPLPVAELREFLEEIAPDTLQDDAA
jgi:hypothetical protein